MPSASSPARRRSALAEARPSRVVYLGSGPHQPAAAECALKLLELTDGEVVAAAWSPLGFRHGPKTLVHDGTLVVSLVSATDPARPYGLDMAREVQTDGRATSLILIDSAPERASVRARFEAPQQAWHHGDAWLAVLFVVFGQVFAFMSSTLRGHATDAPSRRGEVNRVVQNVTIHA